jgi:thioredoxin 1
MVEITDDNYTQMALQSPVPVLVDFSAAWCPPCRVTEPHVKALADLYEGRVRVGYCDVDDNKEITAHFDVRAMPTFLMLKEGKVVGQIVGAVPRAKLEELVKRALT